MKKLSSMLLLIVTYPIFRSFARDKYTGKGFIADVKEAWGKL